MPAVLPQPDQGVPADSRLPGLRGLAKLADLRPTIVTDSREQAPLVFTRLASVTSTLYAGDYSVRGLEASFAVEEEIDRRFGQLLHGRQPRAIRT
jgi:hypothetical protein